MTIRQIVLALALAATLAAVWLAEEGQLGEMGEAGEVSESLDLVPAAARKHAAADQVLKAPFLPPPGLTPLALTNNPARFPVGGVDLFPVQSWKPPPPPPPVVVATPPPPPQAPPLPFKYVGRWNGGEGELVFLAQGEKTVTLRAGQTFAQWRLDSMTASAMNFTYVPLQQQRQLRFGP
jgi:hypothetical protein